MNIIKVKKIVDVFCDNLNIKNPRYINIIKELMTNIILKYERLNIEFVDDKQQYLIKSSNNKYSVEDFFLNRLLFNITSFEIKNTGGRAEYSDWERCIRLNSEKLNNLLDKFTSYNFSDEQKYLAAKKVVMHEFEHALQSSFEFGPKINDIEHYRNLYKKLNDLGLNLSLNEIYDGRRVIDYTSSGNRLQSGMMGNHSYDKYKKFYGTLYLSENDKNYFSENNINEIFNESESLLISKSDEKIPIKFPSGNQLNIRNIESSNYLITNYGFMIKMLLGEKNTFKGMYLDRDVIINCFNNNYGEIFKNVFGEHIKTRYPSFGDIDGWAILNIVIGEAKYSYDDRAKEYSEACHLKLNYAFSLCFEKMVKNQILNGMEFEYLKDEWEEFTKYTLYNMVPEKHAMLPHTVVLKQLQSEIVDLKSYTDDGNKQRL